MAHRKHELAVAVSMILGVSACYVGTDVTALSGADEDTDGAGDDPDGASDDDGETGDDGSDDGTLPPASCEGAQLGSAPMKRLTAVQLQNTVRAAFDVPIASALDYPGVDPDWEGYTNSPGANVVSLLVAEQVQQVAEAVGVEVADDVATFVPCDGDTSACAESFIETFGARLFRRPLVADETSMLRAVYDAASVDGHAIGVASVVVTALQMPQFLYLVEVGEPVDGEPGLHRLSDHEVAARLSYLLLDGPPDAELRSAADGGSLSDGAALREHAERLLAAPESEAALLRFYEEWLGTTHLDVDDKDAEEFPAFDQELVDAFDEELARTVRRLHQGDASLSELLGGSVTEVNPRLAEFYAIGADPSAAADDWWEVELDPDRRRGVLTSPLVLASVSGRTTTSAIRRGRLIRSQFLCNEPPPPPPDAEASVEFPEGASEREKWDILASEAECVSCHAFLNPVGLALEHYDPTGAWRDAYADGTAIDASGSLVERPDEGIVGAAQLSDALLADTEALGRCYTEHWIRYTWGRAAEPEDACTIDAIAESAGTGLNDIVLTLIESDAFRYRREGE